VRESRRCILDLRVPPLGDDPLASRSSTSFPKPCSSSYRLKNVADRLASALLINEFLVFGVVTEGNGGTGHLPLRLLAATLSADPSEAAPARTEQRTAGHSGQSTHRCRGVELLVTATNEIDLAIEGLDQLGEVRQRSGHRSIL